MCFLVHGRHFNGKSIIFMNNAELPWEVISYAILEDVIFPPDLNLRHPDHVIIATAKAVQTELSETIEEYIFN